jgi:fibrillarin-like rRNA methylase
MMRELVKLSEIRPGIVPVLGDARDIAQISPFINKKVDWIHQDLSISDQAKTFVKIAEIFLKNNGIGLLSLKAASERATDGSLEIRFEKAEEILKKSNLDIIEKIDLKGLEEQHVLFYCKMKLVE